MERTGSDIDRDTQLERPKVFASLNSHPLNNIEIHLIQYLFVNAGQRTFYICQRRSTDSLRMQIKVTQAAPAMNSSHRQLATVAESLAKRVGRRLRRQPVMQAQFSWR
ncbi:unnamed protein product [Musa acuminata subsp. burmannicoides]